MLEIICQKFIQNLNTCHGTNYCNFIDSYSFNLCNQLDCSNVGAWPCRCSSSSESPEELEYSLKYAHVLTHTWLHSYPVIFPSQNHLKSLDSQRIGCLTCKAHVLLAQDPKSKSLRTCELFKHSSLHQNWNILLFREFLHLNLVQNPAKINMLFTFSGITLTWTSNIRAFYSSSANLVDRWHFQCVFVAVVQ